MSAVWGPSTKKPCEARGNMVRRRSRLRVKVKRAQQHKKQPPTGITVTVTRVDRGQQIIEDPDRYFDEARERAREQVERDRKLLDA
jgi:hypothetical protein